MALVAILGVVGCGNQTAVYSGTYYRSWVDGDGSVRTVSGPVQMYLEQNGRYQIKGAQRDLPPPGSGKYEKYDEVMFLRDLAPVQGGYDLSLILEGTFDLAQDGGDLVLQQENAFGLSHLLILELQEQ
jgi:hypothetical protein